MITLSQVEDQLKHVGCDFRFWGQPEKRELCNILVPEEHIAKCVNGRYEGGFAMLTVTNHRLLLIDRKPMFLTMEDIRFDMITEMDYNSRLLDGTVNIMTPNRKLTFSTWSQKRLRDLMNYTQQRVLDVRQQHLGQQFRLQQRDPQHAAGLVGGLIMQGSTQQHTLPLNPYTRVPMMMRRRRVYPKFY
jgi:hypothetical protein